jgi:hypothetical protein
VSMSEQATKVYRDMPVRIADLAPADDVLSRVTFENCEIIGPAVLMPRNSEFRGCEFDGPRILWTIEPGRYYIGAVAIDECLFDRCRFRRVGLAGIEAFVAMMTEQLTRPEAQPPPA